MRDKAFDARRAAFDLARQGAEEGAIIGGAPPTRPRRGRIWVRALVAGVIVLLAAVTFGLGTMFGWWSMSSTVQTTTVRVCSKGPVTSLGSTYNGLAAKDVTGSGEVKTYIVKAGTLPGGDTYPNGTRSEQEALTEYAMFREGDLYRVTVTKDGTSSIPNLWLLDELHEPTDEPRQPC